MTHRLLPLVLIPVVLALGACADDGRDSKVVGNGRMGGWDATTLRVEFTTICQTEISVRPRQ